MGDKNKMNGECIELDFIGNLEEAVLRLQEFSDKNKVRKVCINFNGHMLYSDTVTMDSAYLEVTGKTKSEFEEERKKQIEDLKRREEEHKARIPELSIKWKAEGHKNLDEKYWNYWDEIVPIRLNDLYKGMELGACLKIVKALNDGCDFKKAKEIINGQGHSGLSYSLVKSMVCSFCDRGKSFIEYLD